MKKLPERTSDYDRNESKAGDHLPCLVCGRGIKNEGRAKWVHVIKGGSYAWEPGDAVDPAGDLGAYPIGPECSKKYPDLPYLPEE